MVVKDNVRRRRKERINEIMANKTRYYEGSMATLRATDEREGQSDAQLDERLEDPEYVWKLKRQQWDVRTDRHDEKTQNQQGLITIQQIRNQCSIVLLLFCLIWGLFQLDSTWAQRGQGWIERSLTEEFEFEAVARWYNNFFQGAPSFIPTFDKIKDAEKVNAFD